jgi:hypothetical protein
MRLTNPYDESDKVLNVELDFSLNAEQNARRLFEEKRAAEHKKEKTEAATNKALKSAFKSAKVKADIKSTQVFFCFCINFCFIDKSKKNKYYSYSKDILVREISMGNIYFCIIVFFISFSFRFVAFII